MAPNGDSAESERTPAGSNAQAVDRLECPICMDDIADDKEACYPTDCLKRHLFHRACLVPWMREAKHECPSCRAKITKVVMLKGGKNVPIPKLKPKDDDHPMAEPVPPPTEEEFINEDITSESDSEDSDFEGPSTSTSSRSRVTRRTTRQRGSLPISAAERAREDLISRMAMGISSRVGSTVRGRGSTLRIGGRASTSNATRRRTGNTVDEVDLDEVEERLEAQLRRQRRGRRANVYSESEEDEEPVARQPSRRRATIDSDEDESEPVARQPARRAVIESDEDDERNDQIRQPRRRTVESSEEEESEDGSDEESGSDESGTEESGEDEEETESEDSELDDEVLNDQPSTSRAMIPIVRKKRTVKKKTTKRKTTKRKKKSTGGVKRTTRRRKTKKGRKGTKRRRVPAEEAAAERHRVRDVLPSLSLNGAGLEPISDDDAEPAAPKRPRVSNIQPSPPVQPADPLDLLGSIMTSQVVTLAPGRTMDQKDGRLVPNERFAHHIERQKKRGILPVERAEVLPQSASSLPSPVSSPSASTSSSHNGLSKSINSNLGSIQTQSTSREEAIRRPSTDVPRLSSSHSQPASSSHHNLNGTSLPHGHSSRMASDAHIPSTSSSYRNGSSMTSSLPSTSKEYSKRESSDRATSSRHDENGESESRALEKKKNRKAEKKVEQWREEVRLIRYVANTMLIEQRQAGTITAGDHCEAMRHLLEHFYDASIVNKDLIAEFTRREIRKCIRQK